MEPVARDRALTEEDLDALPEDEWRYELSAGRLGREPLPMPRHARIAARVAVDAGLDAG